LYQHDLATSTNVLSLISQIFAFCFLQILEFANHVVSFVQVRGSVPLYWSQTGIKYKPPPKIDRGLYLTEHNFFSIIDRDFSQII